MNPVFWYLQHNSKVKTKTLLEVEVRMKFVSVVGSALFI